MARAMKDSGIAWIGEIPEEWDTRRLRYLCRIATGNQDTQDNNPDGVYPFYVRSPIVERSNSYTFDGPAILMAGDGVGAGKVFHFVDGKYACHQRVYSLHNIVDIDRRFLYYYLLNRFYISIETANSKSTVDSVRLNMLQDFPVMIPDTSEQIRIARFLDAECARIDAVIEQTRASIEEYKKLKQAVITQAVTKGIRPNRPMKNSGIDWIGEIPNDYIVERIKHLGNYRNGLTYSPENILDQEQGVLVLRSSNIQQGKLCFNDNVYVKAEIPDSLFVQKGDIIICSRNGSKELIGKCAIIEEDMIASFGAFMMIYRCVAPKYMYYILNSNVFKYYLSSFLTSTINQLTSSVFGNMRIVYCPDKEEQDEIIEYLDQKTCEFDTIIGKKQDMLTELETYKKSMIFEYVTGKKSIQEVL